MLVILESGRKASFGPTWLIRLGPVLQLVDKVVEFLLSHLSLLKRALLKLRVVPLAMTLVARSKLETNFIKDMKSRDTRLWNVSEQWFEARQKTKGTNMDQGQVGKMVDQQKKKRKKKRSTLKSSSSVGITQ